MAEHAAEPIAGVADAVVAEVLPFETFFRAEYPGLVALATAVTGDRQAGEDLAAEAMSRAYRRWATVSAYERPGAWARRVTINLLHSRRRRLASEVRALLRLPSGRTEPDGAADVAGADHFVRMLEGLAPRQRTAAALHYLDDLPVAEIAGLMGCSEGTVKSHLHDARANIARTIEEHDHGH